MKIGVTVVGFVLIFLTGYLLNKEGQPFNVIVLMLHKLISIAAIAYLILNVMRIGRVAPLGQATWIVCIASGGWLCVVKIMPAFVRTLHQVLSVLTALSNAASLYRMMKIYKNNSYININCL